MLRLLKDGDLNSAQLSNHKSKMNPVIESSFKQSDTGGGEFELGISSLGVHRQKISKIAHQLYMTRNLNGCEPSKSVLILTLPNLHDKHIQ